MGQVVKELGARVCCRILVGVHYTSLLSLGCVGSGMVGGVGFAYTVGANEVDGCVGGAFEAKGGPSSHATGILVGVLNSASGGIVSEEECSARLVD